MSRSAPADPRIDELHGVLGQLLDEAHELAPRDVSPLLARALAPLGFEEVAVYLADHGQRVLVPLAPSDEQLALGIDSTLAGRVYQTMTPMLGGDDTPRLWLPVRDGVDRLGVLCLAGPALVEASDELVAACRQLAALVAQLLISKNYLTDDFLGARRTRDMSLGAEIRWTSLPPLSFSCQRVSVAATLEPAHEVSGDAFDYALNGDQLHVAIFDGMGHELQSALLTDLAVAAYRYCRRRGFSLEETYVHVDHVVRERFADDGFVTAQLATLDTERGELRLLNAGHPGPLLVRHGRIIGVDWKRDALPIGFGSLASEVVDTQVQSLEPGDRLLLYTDGLTEARAPDGELFGEQRLADTIERSCSSHHPPAEAVRRLMRTLGDFRGHEWHDDATVVMVQWPTPLTT